MIISVISMFTKRLKQVFILILNFSFLILIPALFANFNFRHCKVLSSFAFAGMLEYSQKLQKDFSDIRQEILSAYL